MGVDSLGWPVAATLCGLIAGAVANSGIDRLPHDEPLARRLLTCPSCRSPEPLIDALPLVGWLAKGGRCRACRNPISTQQPVVEAVNAVLSRRTGQIDDQAPPPDTANPPGK